MRLKIKLEFLKLFCFELEFETKKEKKDEETHSDDFVDVITDADYTVPSNGHST